jgi:DNA-binding transcriptional regulator LsrR (DeoR family)
VRPPELRGHGMMPMEQAVMNRFDAGATLADIADELELSRKRVKAIVERYRCTSASRFHEDARRSTARLLEALLRYQARHGMTA